MKAFLYSFVVAFGFLVSSVDGLCSICPNGVDEGLLDADPTGEGADTCAEIDIIYQSLDPFACLAQKPAVMPNCCPSQLPTYAVDNVCGWCPNGVPDVYQEIPDIILPENTTCLNYMELVSFTEDSDGCSFFDRSATICCPDDAGPIFKCDFCSKGLEFPDLDPEDDGTNCTVLQALVNLVPDESSCGLFKSLELNCCPSTTELTPCQFCSQGLEVLDTTPFPDGATCTDLQNNATAVGEGPLCEFLKTGEDFCCPSTTDSCVCDFCSDGVLFPNQTLGVVLSDYGLMGDETCADMVAFAALAPNATSCDLIKSFEGTCCPSSSNQNPTPPTTTSPPDSTPPPTTMTTPPISTPPPTSPPVQNPTLAPAGSGGGGDTKDEATSDSPSIRGMVMAIVLCTFTALVSC